MQRGSIFLCNHHYETSHRSRTVKTRCLSEQPGRFSRAARAQALEGVCPHRLLHAALPQRPLRHACGSGVRRGVAPLPSATWRPRAGGRPSFPAEGRRTPPAPSGTSAELSARFVSGAVPAPRSGCAQSWRALPSARARRRLSLAPAALPPPPPSPASERASSAAEAAEIGICLPAARRRRRRRRAEGRAGREARAPARRPARDEDCAAARGATGLGPLHAEGGGRAGPRRPAAVGGRLRRALEDEFLGIPVSWRAAGGVRVRRGRPANFGATVAAPGRPQRASAGPAGDPGPEARPARARPFVRLRTTPGTLLESLNGNGARLPLRSRAADPGTGSRDPARKRKRSVFSAGMEAGRSARPALQLGCGKAPGFSLGPCELVHLLLCAALRCHVCCDSALRFRKTLCWVACPSPSPSRLLAERFGKEKKNKVK